MNKVGAVSVVVLGGIISTKLYENHTRKEHHKAVELAKPYLPTLSESILEDIASKTAEGKKTCVIIGGGVAGISTAYELCEKGHNVVMFEKYADTGQQCSAAPAGGMQRSNPTVDSSMWVAASKSVLGLAPFQYFRINFWETLTDPHYLRWFMGFSYNSAMVAEKKQRFYQGQMLNFTNWAIDDIFSTIEKEGITGRVGLVKTGALQIFYDKSLYEKAIKKNQGPPSDGEVTKILSRDEVFELEPCLKNISDDGHGNGSDNIIGGSFQVTAASGSCLGFTNGIMKVLHSKHKRRFTAENNISVLDFDTVDGRISCLHTNRGTLNVPEGVDIVIAAGSWTPIILRKLHLYCPVYPMKGYNLIADIKSTGLKKTDFPQRIIQDGYIFTSTLNDELRVASFGEFNGWNVELNPSIVQELLTQAGRIFPTLGNALKVEGDNKFDLPKVPEGMEVKTGLRPFVSDGRLLIGRISKYSNLYVNAGPGFNGWKVATGAAKVLTADITGDTSELPTSFDRAIFSPKHRIKHSPLFCGLVNVLTYNE